MSDESEKAAEPPVDTETKSPFQYSILQLMILTAAVAGVLAIGTQATRAGILAVVAFVLAFTFYSTVILSLNLFLITLPQIESIKKIFWGAFIILLGLCINLLLFVTLFDWLSK